MMMIVRIQFSALDLEADSLEIQVGVGSIPHFVMFHQFVFYEASFRETQ